MSSVSLSQPAGAHAGNAALLASALAAIFWGTNFEATRIVLSELSPWTAGATRFVIAAAAILLWLALTERIRLPVLRRNLLQFIVLGIVGVGGFNAALFVGMQTSSPVTAALIMGTSPLTTTLIDSAIRRRMPAGIALAGMAIGLFGVALTVGAFSGAHFARGDLLIALGSLAWALYTIGCRRWVIDASPMETSTWTMVFGAISMVIAAFAVETPFAALTRISAVGWTAILHMALIGSVLAYIFWQIGIAARGPAATSVLFNLVPVSALVVAAAFGRIPDWSQVLGVAIAIFGVLLASGRFTRSKQIA
ncbi:DMT family transporter [Consotaella salsifontis]|uniref:EamA-like transporter family protein n=1 Tax=Consotaella salsifontis TaxID=1365950 RepID=A0A1T4MPL9_9HYPH|nr:DMT family transporter [Consotaella salsifontis]SJZ68989.1 EamA-like transporter family protein [Consotaella salsifontis]